MDPGACAPAATHRPALPDERHEGPAAPEGACGSTTEPGLARQGGAKLRALRGWSGPLLRPCDGTLLTCWSSDEGDDRWSKQNRVSQPGAQTKEVIQLETKTKEVLLLQGGMGFQPAMDADIGVLREDLVHCVSSHQPWHTHRTPRWALDNATLRLWGALAQNAYSFERKRFVCMAAVLTDGLTGLLLVKDMPITSEGSAQEARATGKWLERLLAGLA